MKTNVLDTSVEAFYSLLNNGCKTQADRIEAIVRAYPEPISLQEIKYIYNGLHGTDIDVSSVSGRVNGLITANRLERLKPTRICTRSGESIHPVRIKAKQAALFAELECA